MTLVLLLTAASGAWAEEKSETISTTATQMEYTGEHFKITTNDLYDGLAVADLRCYDDGQRYISVETLDGQNISKLDLQISFISDTSIDNLSLSSGTKSYDSNKKVLTITNVNADHVQITLTEVDQCGIVTISSVTCYYEESPSGPEVAWNASTKTGTFEMPASDVVLTPQYAPTAKWDVENAGTTEEKVLQPAALEGIIAGQDAAIVTPGQSAQGTVMYAVTTTAEAAPALTAFSPTVPTAKDIADDGATLYVWYYIQGADAPQGVAATLDNTFDNTEPAYLTVQVLTNKFDIQFNAANANTIEAGKATVTVGGTDKTGDITEGKLQGVKMGSEVKVKANTGYKLRKVEVKKKAAAPTTITVTWNGADITGTGGGTSFTKDGVTITAGDIEFMDKNFIGGGTFTTTLGNFTKIEVTTDGWYASGTGWSGSTWTGNASSVSFSGEIMGYGGDNLKFVFTIEPTN